MARLDDGWCAALDRETMRCAIYDSHPSICRGFKMGGDECLANEQIIQVGGIVRACRGESFEYLS